jgi:hypothetical protein
VAKRRGLKPPISKDDEELIARQRVVCRCAVCGERLGENVSLREAAKLLAAHREQAHPSRSNQELQREESERRILSAFNGTWITVRELGAGSGLSEAVVRKHLARLVEEGRVERMEADRGNVSVFRRRGA